MFINNDLFRYFPMATLCLALLVPVAAFANQFREVDLASKVEQSDLVLILKVVDVGSGGCIEMYSCARVDVKKTLKGAPGKDMQILFDGPSSEAHPRCCNVGTTYLAFLRKTLRPGIYESVNGPFGIYAVHP